MRKHSLYSIQLSLTVQSTESSTVIHYSEFFMKFSDIWTARSILTSLKNIKNLLQNQSSTKRETKFIKKKPKDRQKGCTEYVL